MTNYELKKGTRIAFILSLILHVFLALLLGIVLLEQPRESTRESVSVDITSALKRVSPPRRITLRESIPDMHQIRKKGEKAQLRPKPIKREDINVKYNNHVIPSNLPADIPDVTTDVERLRSKIEKPLPKLVGVKLSKPGTGTKRSTGDSSDGVIGTPPGGADIFETALYWIARNLVGKNKTGKEDIVFIVDASGSMEENIAAVAKYISRMIEVFEESGLDYTMGVIRYNRILKTNDVKIYEQTKDAREIRSILRSIKCDGDERTLDAIEMGVAQVKFRQPVDKTFILVTDETLTPRTNTRQAHPEFGLKQMLQEDFQNILRICKGNSIKVNVLGINDEMQKALAKETEGLWFQIPQAEDAQ